MKKILLLIGLFSILRVEGQNVIKPIEMTNGGNPHSVYRDYTYVREGTICTSDNKIIKWYIDISCDTCEYESIFSSTFDNNTNSISFIAHPVWFKFVQQADYIDVGGVLYKKVTNNKPEWEWKLIPPKPQLKQ